MQTEWNQNEYNEGEEYAFQTLRRDGRPKTLGWSVAALVLGIVAAITSAFGWSSIILGAAAIACAVVSRLVLGYFDGKSIAGLILGIFGAVFGVAMIIYSFTLDEEEAKYLWDYLKQFFENAAEME